VTNTVNKPVPVCWLLQEIIKADEDNWFNCTLDCPSNEYFRSKKNTCILCSDKVAGCGRCEDEETAINMGMCEDPITKEIINDCTICTKCLKGLFMDEISQCSKVKNCNKSISTDIIQCELCKDGFYLWKHSINLIDEVDACINKEECELVFKRKDSSGVPTTGFYTAVDDEIPLCRPCHTNCLSCKDMNQCVKCAKPHGDSDRAPFYLNKRGQCCYVRGCGDCGPDPNGTRDMNGVITNDSNKDHICKYCDRG